VLLWLPVLPVSILLFAVRDAGIAVAACVYAVREERREKEARKTTITGHAGNITTAAAALPLGTARTKYVSGGGESPNFDTTHANMLTLVPDRKRDTSLLLEVWNAHIFG
jgi:hypothetical protein